MPAHVHQQAGNSLSRHAVRLGARSRGALPLVRNQGMVQPYHQSDVGRRDAAKGSTTALTPIDWKGLDGSDSSRLGLISA